MGQALRTTDQPRHGRQHHAGADSWLEVRSLKPTTGTGRRPLRRRRPPGRGKRATTAPQGRLSWGRVSKGK